VEIFFFDCGFGGVALSEVEEGCGLVWGLAPLFSLLRCGWGLGLVQVAIPMCHNVRTRNITRRYGLSGIARCYNCMHGWVGVRGVAWRGVACT
jgi:hypothetical protein